MPQQPLSTMTANHRIEQAKYWRKIEGETKSSLRRIKNDSAETLLDTVFKDEFLRTTMTRITTVYEHIVDEILIGQTSLISTTFNPFPFVSSTPMHAIESDFVVPASRPPVQKSRSQPKIHTYAQPIIFEANNTLNISELPSNFGQSFLRLGDVIPDVKLQPQLDSFLNSCLNISHDAPSNVLQNGESASESDFVAPVSRPEIQTNVQPIISEANNTLNIPELPSYFGQSFLRSGDVIPDVELQPQLDSFLKSCLNVNHEAPPDGVLQNGESASVNPNNEFETNAVTVGDDTHALIVEALQCSSGTTFIAPEEFMENRISEAEPVLNGAIDSSCEPNVVEEIPCENVINLAPVDDIVDLTAECEASNSSNAGSNGGTKKQTSVRRPKRKNPFKGVSDLRNSSKKRKVEDVSAPVREKKDGKFHCEVCEYSTSRRSDLKRHNRVHTGVMPFKCGKCEQAFNRKEHLNNHMRTHEKHLKFQCAICRQRFNSQEAKESHQDRCNKRSYECYLCRHLSDNKASLVIHFRTHTGEKPFKCGKCEQAFNQKGSLNSHMRTHEKHLKFQCTICRRRFKSREAKESHQDGCNKRSYECYVCRHSSDNKALLVTHFRTHTGEKPFQCSHCSKQFNLKCNLTRHIKRCHT